MTRISHRSRATGFTLIELLVALALAGVVSLLLVHGIGLAASGFERLSRGAERLDQSRGVEDVLRRTFASAAAIPSLGPVSGFSGSAARVSFLTLTTDNGPGLHRIEIAVDLAGGERRLMLSRHLVEAGAGGRVERSILARGVRVFHLAYFGVASPGEEPGWHDRWDGLGYLPTLVRIEFDTADAPMRPPLIVRVWNAG